MYVPDPKDPSARIEAALFAHIDRGDDYVDHHTFFMSKNLTAHVHHASFEVHDFDTQILGHQYVSTDSREASAHFISNERSILL